MKRSAIFLCGVAMLLRALCASQELANNDTNTGDMEEANRLKILLDSTHSIIETTSEPKISTTSTPTTTSMSAHTSKSNSQLTSGTKEDPDYSFQNERLPFLSDDEFNNLSDDANPLYFLKQMPERSKPQEPTPSPVPVSGSPIYITIPIYINTSGKIPLSLTIGEQEMQRVPNHKKSESTKTPNSHFNRLVGMIEPSRRRTTNRHRSQSRSKIQPLKDQNELNRRKRIQ